MFAVIINFFDTRLNRQYAHFDWTPHLAEIQDILTDDQFYVPLNNHLFLRQALNAKNIEEVKFALKMLNAKNSQEVRPALKTSHNRLVASALRAALTVKKSCPPQT